MEIKQSLRNWRKSNNISQREVAEKIGIHKNQYQRYETDIEIPAKTIRKIAIEYNVSADILLGIK